MKQSVLPAASSSLPPPHLTLIKDGQRQPRHNKDGSADRRHSNAKPGVSSEVYAFKTVEEISAVNAVFDRDIAANVGLARQIACRNKLLFNVGINIGLRVSDLRSLKWSFFFDADGTMKDCESLMPKKTRKKKKFVKIFCNANVEKAIDWYIAQYPITDLDSFIFFSAKAGEPIQERTVWKIIKGAAKEAGIKQNIGTHSLRKTFGYWAWHLADDKEAALVDLMHIFNHHGITSTRRYIGLLDEDIREVFDSLDFGEDYLTEFQINT